MKLRMEDNDLFKPIKQALKQHLLESENTHPEISYSSSYLREVWLRLNAHLLPKVGLYLFLGILMTAIIAPFLTEHTYYETQLHLKNQPPSLVFWFGTDELGRDLFVRCWWGARISLFVGIFASLIDLIIGVLYGSIAGYYGGKVDECMMRIADILNTIPYFLLVILLIVLIGSGIVTVMIALTITGWINMARIVRSKILQLKQQDFVKAALILGASHRHILFHHLIPNAIGPILVTLTFTIPIVIFTEAFLSFLGLGIQAPIASWGTLASDGLTALRFYPWRLLIPAILICLTLLSLNLLGDGLRDALDPRMRS